MESKKVITSGPVTPSTINTPLDFRTRVNTVDEIYNIDLPFVGMIVYVIDENKYYKIKTLKSKEIGSQLIENAAVDTFEKLLTIEDTVITLQQEIAELRAIIEELKNVPETPEDENFIPTITESEGIKYIIASKLIPDEIEALTKATEDVDVIGFIIEPRLTYYSHGYASPFYYECRNHFDIEFKNGSKIDYIKELKLQIEIPLLDTNLEFSKSDIYIENEKVNITFEVRDDDPNFNNNKFLYNLYTSSGNEGNLTSIWNFELELYVDSNPVKIKHSIYLFK